MVYFEVDWGATSAFDGFLAKQLSFCRSKRSWGKILNKSNSAV